MSEQHIQIISRELSIPAGHVRATAELLAADATVPFVARYRKEVTGGLDEVAIAAIRDRLDGLKALDERRAAVISSLDERGLLTDELREQLDAAATVARIEDIYLPFRPKRRTRAMIAREKGLEPLANILLMQDATDPVTAAVSHLDQEKGVATADDALAGARDIIAETVSEDQTARARMRELFAAKAVLRSRVIPDKEAEGAKFRDYFDWQEPARTAPSHRILAMRRGEEEGFLSLRMLPPEDEAIALLEGMFVRNDTGSGRQVRLAVRDAYKRLLSLSMETELRLATKKRADDEAIRVFAANLRELLLAPPLGRRNVLALDPGFRTGCKLVCLDRQGGLLHNDTIFPTLSERQRDDAAAKLRALVERFAIEAVAIGNGTASRETESFVRSLGLPRSVVIVMVNESGASVYSASDLAREEFPDHDVTVRGAVSIGRRLMDPLAELVKIDPKSIGVGQYQHDVDQHQLRTSLDDTVLSCVNAVGVELNTASKELLSYVSGLGPSLARNIVEYRDSHGAFASRAELLKVPRLGPKAFEQAAGFLRIAGGANPLDASAVHPERYSVVERIAADMGSTLQGLISSFTALRPKIRLERYVDGSCGLPTLNDIMAELARPGRDPRAEFEAFAFADGVEKIDDLRPGMRLPGIVTNVTAFGAFVDIGVHQDGLVHVSQLADRFVRNPADVVKVQQRVEVTVLDVDLPRKRISLSMRTNARPASS